MKKSPVTANAETTASSYSFSANKDSWLTSVMKSMLLSRLESIRHGRLTIHDRGEVYSFGQLNDTVPVDAEVKIHHPRVYRQMVLGGSIGTGESYMDGDWTSPNPTDVIRVIAGNREVFEKMSSGMAIFTRQLQKFYHWTRKNTIEGSRKNISAHYDLGNDFFELFLDPTMTYSAGVFNDQAETMEEASIEKYDRLCKKLNLNEEDHLLEIGTGWGGMAIHAAKYYGCLVTTTTISKEQYAYAAKRIREEGLEDQITLLLQDYRQLEGRFTKVVSIEMVEAIGAEYYPAYFQKIDELLTADGAAALQVITIEDSKYDVARRNVDFIKRYVFPGCCIPSMTALLNAASKSSSLTLFHLEDNTWNYARTLRIWREKLMENYDEIKNLGYSDQFLRLWDFYLCYCEGGFWERSIGNVQVIFTKPMTRRESILPALQ